MVPLLTCLEALLGVVNTCLPIMRPVFARFGDSKFWSYFIAYSTARSTSKRRLFSRFTGNPSNSDRSENGSGAYGSEKGDEEGGRQSWPIQQQHKRNLITPRFVDPKAAQVLFSHHHHHSNQSSVTSGRAPNQWPLPPPPPKTPYSNKPDNNPNWEENKVPGIMVQTDLDVEMADSVDSDHRPLKDEYAAGQNNQGW